MSTLCRAKWERGNVRGARPSRSPGGASRAALPVKEVFGGTPDPAPETHALPIHLSACLKGRVNGGRKISDNRKYFGNISEKRPFSEIISDLFFWANPVKTGQACRKSVPVHNRPCQSKRACRAAAPKAVPLNAFGVRGEGGGPARHHKSCQSDCNLWLMVYCEPVVASGCIV